MSTLDIPSVIGTGHFGGGNQDDAPDTPSVDWLTWKPERELVADCLEGTRAFRRRKDVYTPRLPGERIQRIDQTGEEFDPYEHRIRLGFVTNFFGDTVAKIARMPFRQAIKVNGLPPKMEYLLRDVDGHRTTLEAFAKGIYGDVLAYGSSVGHVDYSRVDAVTAGGSVSRGEAQRGGHRARFRSMPILSLREHRQMRSGGLSRVRFVEEITESKQGKSFADESIRIVSDYRIDEAGRPILERWRFDNDDKEWKEDGDTEIATFEIAGSPVGRLPMTPIGDLHAAPPMLALAEVTLAHYLSDLANRHGLSVARFAILLMTGLPQQPGKAGKEKTAKPEVVFAPAVVLGFSSEDVDARFLEVDGKGLELGMKDTERLSSQAERMGAQPLARDMGNKTATGAEIDERRTMSPAQEMVGQVSDGLEAMFRDAAIFHGENLPKDFSVRIFDDFGMTRIASDVLRILLDGVTSGEVLPRRLLEALQSVGAIDDDADIDEELGELKREADRRGLGGESGGAVIEDEDLDTVVEP